MNKKKHKEDFTSTGNCSRADSNNTSTSRV
jgi:hypothetical protein